MALTNLDVWRTFTEEEKIDALRKRECIAFNFTIKMLTIMESELNPITKLMAMNDLLLTGMIEPNESVVNEETEIYDAKL